MKYILRISIFISLSAIFACSEDFLETYPSEQLSAQDINASGEIRPYILIGYLNGLYQTMYTAGSGGTDLNHDDFGQKGWDIYSDLLSHDMVLGGVNYGWYSSVADLTAPESYTNLSNYMPWRFYYRIIFSANNLIDGFDIEDGLPEDDVAKANLGQALAIRAYSYYNLMQLFVNDYNPGELAIPLYTSAGSEPHGLSTAEEIYAVILNDLETSVELLDGFNRDAKFRINQNVARAMLAYAYAATGRNTEAAQVAKAVIDSGEFPLLQAEDLVYDSTTGTGGGFNDVSTPGWMWGQDLTLDTGLGLVSWWGQMDIYSYSYAWAGDTKVIDNSLYSQISSDDIRRKQFVGFGNKTPSKKFFDLGRVSGGQRNVTTDYIYMRIEEMYLLFAETAAKSGAEGGESAAKNTILELMRIRIPEDDDYNDYVDYLNGLSGQSLIDEISLQTRIELWGEGKSYWLMKRNQETRTRGSNHLWYAGESFSYDDPRLTFEIPQSEVQNNPFLN